MLYLFKLFSVHASLCCIAILLPMSSIAAQETLPYIFKNTSQFSDEDIYVAIVGITDGHVWIDCKTSTVKPMAISDNTVPGPIINGNKGPGNNGLYADCFTKLTEIPNYTVNLPKIAGCRILMSVGSQLYLYFFGHSGAPSGYAAPNLANSTDPNTGIRFEMIELTWNDYGLWTNTTRVDSYQYAMGLEVFGANNFYKKTGELKTHEQIISDWKSSVPAEFQDCLDEDHEVIHAPSKTAEFGTGGAHENYLKNYIDQIWEKYKLEDLTFTSDAGTWQGRVEGERFVFHNLTNSSGNATGIISRRPTTQEALEGKGVLAEDVQKLSTQTLDLVVQAQICAALNRGAIDLDAPTGSTQQWGDENSYFKNSTYNEYVKFWHNPDISYNSKSYGFCYDDVYDQSSTIHCPGSDPERVLVTFGGFGNIGQTKINDLTNKENNSICKFNIRGRIVKLSNKLTGPVNLKIFSLNGVLIVDRIVDEGMLILNKDLSPGTYLWKIKSESLVGNEILRKGRFFINK